SEREMLDIMAITTFSPHTRDEVHGYTWFWHAGGPTVPGWYNSGWSYGWDNTPYQNTAYGVYASPGGKKLPRPARGRVGVLEADKIQGVGGVPRAGPGDPQPRRN